MSEADLTAFKADLLKDLRMELISLHLGDDYLLELDEAARLLGCSVRKLYRLNEDNTIYIGHFGSSPRLSLGQVRRLMRESVTPKR